MKPLFTQLSVHTTIFVVLISFSTNITFAEIQKPSEEDIRDLNRQLKEIEKRTKEIRKQSEGTHDLKVLHKAEKSGLSSVLKAVSPQGGDFEIQSDGAIKITPKDSSIAKKLIDKTALETHSNSSPQKISKGSKKIMERLQKANKQGLSALLNKLGAEGGNFELIENGGIKIIPNNATKAKKLASKTTATSKLIKQKNLKVLTTKLRGLDTRVNSWRKVRSAANAWLKIKNKKGLSVGKIRHIKWLYVVSIVTKKGNMDTQLVIRASDGKTVAYTQNTFEIFN